MPSARFLLRHEILGTGAADSGWSKEFDSMDEAKRAADEQWWVADARAIRQTIVDAATGKQVFRTNEAAWIEVPRKVSLFKR